MGYVSSQECTDHIDATPKNYTHTYIYNYIYIPDICFPRPASPPVKRGGVGRNGPWGFQTILDPDGSIVAGDGDGPRLITFKIFMCLG